MRILHTSDWHLGRTLHGVDLSDAHATFFDFLITTVREEKIDAVIVSGDVYDRALPPLDAVSLLEDALLRITALCPVVMTPGNHDSAIRLGFGSAFYTDRLHILSRIDELANPVLITGSDDTCAAIYGFPYLDPDAAKEALHPWGEPDTAGNLVVARSHEATIAAAMRAVRSDLSNRRASSPKLIGIVMAHAFVVGGQPSESERDISVGGVQSVPAGIFADDIDYVALGHLHGQQTLSSGGRAILRYSGSPLAFSFSEEKHTKSVTIVDCDQDGNITTSCIPTPVPRRLSSLSGTLEEILSPRYESQREDWVRVTVKQDSFPDSFYSTIKEIFPYALHIVYENTAPRSAPLGPGREAVSPQVVAESFVLDVAGRDPSTVEKQVLAAAITAARKDTSK
ncbi:MAG: exonuclease SbcCD subunit D [Propionibacteriaceae bacterium]